MSNHNHYSSPLRSCFCTTPTTGNHRAITAAAQSQSEPQPQPPLSCNIPNLTTTLYHTNSGLFSLTWSRSSLFRHSLHLNSFSGDDDTSLSTPFFSLHIKPILFWSKHGCKKLTKIKNGYIYWDFSRAKFESSPEPKSGFFIAIVVAGEMILLAGDSPNEAYARTKARTMLEKSQVMVVKREHVYGNRVYRTKAKFNGIEREISIDCRLVDDPRLIISLDSKRVLEIQHLGWKFRGNEKIEIDGGLNVQVSWDVYNWLFEDDDEEGYAQFMFRFEKKEFENEMVLWSQQSFGFEYETKKMKKCSIKNSRRSSYSSSSSMASSGSSSSSNSVLEWESMEENELKGPSGFSLIVYAWKN